MIVVCGTCLALISSVDERPRSIEVVEGDAVKRFGHRKYLGYLNPTLSINRRLCTTRFSVSFGVSE